MKCAQMYILTLHIQFFSFPETKKPIFFKGCNYMYFPVNQKYASIENVKMYNEDITRSYTETLL